MHIILGTSEILLNYYEDESSECSNCGNHGLTFRVVQNYYHVYGLPSYPLQKYTGLYCTNCGLKHNNVMSEIATILEKESKTPLYLYTGAILLFLIISAFILILSI